MIYLKSSKNKFYSFSSYFNTRPFLKIQIEDPSETNPFDMGLFIKVQIQINDLRFKTFIFTKRKASADIEPTSQFRKAIVGIFLSLSKKLYRIRRSKKERQMNNKKSNLKLQNPTHKKSWKHHSEKKTE